MAKRPKLDLLALTYEESYKQEIICLEEQTSFLREIINMQINEEFNANNFIREYLEKTFRIVMASQDGNWNYTKPQNAKASFKER